MRPREMKRAKKLNDKILDYHKKKRPLLGIKKKIDLDVLIEQLLESIRRIEYIKILLVRQFDERRLDPKTEYFDPLKAAILFNKKGKIEEACWLVFLFTHFGKHKVSGYRLIRDIYGGLNSDGIWTWERISSDLELFREWYCKNEHILKGADGIKRGFGDHRKYESLSVSGTLEVIESYIQWVNCNQSHKDMVRNIHKRVGQNPYEVFDYLYTNMSVRRFGRLAKFDYLTMLGKLEILPIEPGSPYIIGSTGPLRGAKLLLTGDAESQMNSEKLNEILSDLGHHINVPMQVIEDALCNWQKSPSKFIPYRG